MPADAGDLFFFQHPQQPSLQRQRHFAYLVKKQRATVGDFEQPGATSASRAGKRPFLIAKQLCFQQRFGNRPAVDGNKRMRLFALSRIVAGKIFPMNRLGRQLFARPRFPLNQHRRTGAGIQQNSLPYLFHLW